VCGGSGGSVAVIIMKRYPFCADALRYLNGIQALDGVDCYIYEMFPYCEAFDEWSEEVLKMRSVRPQIPKIIHYIWAGGNPLPEQNKMWMESWKKHCPDYEIKLWNESNYDFGKNKYLADVYAAGKWGYASDYARLDIIHQYGGIYLDTDVELLKSLDELLSLPAFFGLTFHGAVSTGIGFGAAKGNELIKEMRDVYDDVSFLNDDGTYNLASCLLYQTEVLRRHGFRGGNRFTILRDAVIFPVTFFCPMSAAFGVVKNFKNSFSVHHFDCTSMESGEYLTLKESRGFFETGRKERRMV
jgi:hypothetical protein